MYRSIGRNLGYLLSGYLGTRHLLPGVESLGTSGTIVGRLGSMMAKTKEVVNRSVEQYSGVGVSGIDLLQECEL